MAEPVTSFTPNPDLFAVIKECTENYEVGEPDAEWPNNIISRSAVVYGNGAIARRKDPIQFAVEPDELALCQRLANQAKDVAIGMEVGMGSEAIEEFQPFFIAANQGEAKPGIINATWVQQKFGGTLFPLITITIEPMEESGIWWSEVLEDFSESPEEEQEAGLARWRAMIEWFRDQEELDQPMFIRIGDGQSMWDLDSSDFPPGTEITGCVFPRLMVALTKKGSLVGLFGVCVQT